MLNILTNDVYWGILGGCVKYTMTYEDDQQRRRILKTMEADKDLPSGEVAKLLEAHVQTCAEDINNRRFTRSAPGWQCMADFYQAESSLPEGGDGDNALFNLDQYLNLQKSLAEANPEYKIKSVDLKTEVYSSGKGAASSTGAQSFMTVESTGIPPGMVRHSVGVTTHRYTKGKWWCVHYVGIRGSLGHQYY